MARSSLARANDAGEADHLLAIEVETSEKVHANRRDEVYLRVGDENRKLTFAQRQELLYDKGQATFETTVVPDARREDLDEQLLRSYADAAKHMPSLPGRSPGTADLGDLRAGRTRDSWGRREARARRAGGVQAEWSGDLDRVLETSGNFFGERDDQVSIEGNQEPQGPPARRPPRLTEVVPVRFPPQTIDDVRRLAGAEDRSVSSWIRRAVDKELEHARTRADSAEAN